MRRTALSFLFLSLFCLRPAMAAAPPAVDTKLVGRYEVNNGGPIATAVALRANGRFGWNLLFVENDVFMAGTWQVRDGEVVLTADPVEAPRIRLAPAGKSALPKPQTGYWIAHVAHGGDARMPRLDIEFLAASGASARASTDSAGDAAVEMPAAQTWVSLKIRAADSEGAWITLPVSSEVAKQGMAVVTIDNPQSLIAPYFTTLRLTVRGDDLVVALGPLTGMVYERGEPEKTPAER